MAMSKTPPKSLVPIGGTVINLSKPMVATMHGRQHGNDSSPNLELNRRRMLTLAVSSFVGLQLPGQLLHAHSAPPSCTSPIPQNHAPSNGGSCPYPIPWLDKNGDHNQSPMPSVELSSIYHFKGKLARCNGFHGMGTDNKGNRLAFGTPTTDYSYMAGEYWAARQAHQAIFAHT
jgi:hypothetical protein